MECWIPQSRRQIKKPKMKLGFVVVNNKMNFLTKFLTFFILKTWLLFFYFFFILFSFSALKDGEDPSSVFRHAFPTSLMVPLLQRGGIAKGRPLPYGQLELVRSALSASLDLFYFKMTETRQRRKALLFYNVVLVVVILMKKHGRLLQRCFVLSPLFFLFLWK